MTEYADNQQQTESGLTRKDLIKKLSGIGVGIGVGAALLPASIAVDTATEAVTNRKSGNAAFDKDLEVACGRAVDKERCEYDFMQDTIKKETLDIVVVAPITEEAIFRAVPSGFVKTRKEGLGLSRQELLVGGASSVTFGIAHNLAAWDARRIPTPQIVGGMTLWYLQRKFGYLSNVAAHSTLNGLVVASVRSLPPPKS